MPGVYLNLDLPSLSDSLATIVSKLVTAISAIQTDLANKVVPSEIYMNQALAMNGASVLNVGSLELVAGNPPSTPGSVYYSAGEFYAVDAAGAFRISNNGALDVATAGTIGGDYGGTNPASVTYNDISGEYRFYQDVGVWANLSAGDVILNGTNGSVKLGVDDAINSARQVIFKSLPTTGVSMLVYNAATSTIEDGSVTRATNNSLFADIECGTINMSGKIQVGSAGDYSHSFAMAKAVPFTGVVHAGTMSLIGYAVTASSPTWTYRSPILDLRLGDQIVGYQVEVKRSHTSTIITTLNHLPDGAFDPVPVFTEGGNVGSDLYNQGPSGLAFTIVTGDRYFIEVSGTDTSDEIHQMFVFWKHP